MNQKDPDIGKRGRKIFALSFKCDKCEKSFFNDEILALHQEAVHKNVSKLQKENDLQCEYCDKSYKHKRSL